MPVRRCCDGLLLAAHLILVELRGAAILCVSAWSCLKQVTVRLALSDKKEITFQKTKEACLAMGKEKEGAPTSVQGILTQVNDAVVEYMISNPMRSDFESHDGLIVGSFNGLLPKLVCCLVAWVVLLYVFCVVYVVFYRGAGDWRSGAYIKAVWRLKDHIVMKFFGYSMVFLTVGLVTGLVAISITEPVESDFNPVIGAIISNISGIVLWMLGLTSFIQSGLRPGFRWDDDSFDGLVFNRRVFGDFHDSCDLFARRVSIAAWKVRMPEDDPAQSSASQGTCGSLCCSKPRTLKDLIKYQAREKDVETVFGMSLPDIQVGPDSDPSAPLLKA